MLLVKKRLILLVTLIIIAALTISLTLLASQRQNRVELRVLIAGSLMVPFQALEKGFEAKYPDVDVVLEGHGSVQVIRNIIDLGKEADLAAVADCQLIPLLMYQTQMPDGHGPYADWYIKFATNKIGIAFTNSSLYASEITADNWYEILPRPDVRIGLADPSIDSLGYRALMVVQLAEDYYSDDTIFKKLIADNFAADIEVVKTNGVSTIKVPELLQPIQKRILLRSYSIQLLALLESGEVDYAFEYESVAKQSELRFLELPQAIDLSSQNYTDQYKRVRVELEFQRFAEVVPEFEGAPIIYGITIPRNAPHQQEAIKFLEYLVGPEGQQIFSENYHPPLTPAEADDISKVPAALRPLLK
jgi:molybdate/tungstate transport system substrate-binding protein